MSDPTYGDPDDPFGDSGARKRPKWQIAKTDFQKRILATCGRTYFQARSERTDVVLIEKSMMPIAVAEDQRLPTEWVDHCIKFAKDRKLPFPNLIKYILNRDKMEDWIRNYKSKHKIEPVKNLDGLFTE